MFGSCSLCTSSSLTGRTSPSLLGSVRMLVDTCNRAREGLLILGPARNEMQGRRQG